MIREWDVVDRSKYRGSYANVVMSPRISPNSNSHDPGVHHSVLARLSLDPSNSLPSIDGGNNFPTFTSSNNIPLRRT